MIDQVIPATIALTTGVGVIIQRLHNRINSLDRRIDNMELRIAESYVSKGDFNLALSRMEDHMIRIEEKLDELVRGTRN
tara:strand:- start:1724 stop:1960 length:237 start_codon:yes stop_codon:yes gene_type:complete